MKRSTMVLAGMTFISFCRLFGSIGPDNWGEVETYFAQEKNRINPMPQEQLYKELEKFEKLIDARERILRGATKEMRLADKQLMKWNMVRNYLSDKLGIEDQEPEWY